MHHWRQADRLHVRCGHAQLRAVDTIHLQRTCQLKPCSNRRCEPAVLGVQRQVEILAANARPRVMLIDAHTVWQANKQGAVLPQLMLM